MLKKPVHPGQRLRQECFEPRGLTVTEVAKQLGDVYKRQSASLEVTTRSPSHARWHEHADATFPLASWLLNVLPWWAWTLRDRYTCWNRQSTCLLYTSRCV